MNNFPIIVEDSENIRVEKCKGESFIQILRFLFVKLFYPIPEVICRREKKSYLFCMPFLTHPCIKQILVWLYFWSQINCH